MGRDLLSPDPAAFVRSPGLAAATPLTWPGPPVTFDRGSGSTPADLIADAHEEADIAASQVAASAPWLYDSTMLDAALTYAALGLPVFPLRPRNKVPATLHGVKDATTDAEQIRSWWTQAADYNIGLACSADYSVLDIDKDDEVDGEKSLGAWLLERGLTWAAVPDCPTVLTAGGGMHLVYKNLADSNKAGVVPKVDVRSTGGYVVAPPSIGANGERYIWLVSLMDLAFPVGGGRPANPYAGDRLIIPDAGDHLRALAAGERRRAPAPAPSRLAGRSHAGGGPGSSYSTYALRALEGEVRSVVDAPEGVRNSTLHEAAVKLGTLVGGGALDGTIVVHALYMAGIQSGLSDRETEATIASGMKYGVEHPRQIPA